MNGRTHIQSLAATLVALPLLACTGVEPHEGDDPRFWSDDELLEALEDEALEGPEASLPPRIFQKLPGGDPLPLGLRAEGDWSEDDDGIAAIEEITAASDCQPAAVDPEMVCPDPDAPGVSYVDEDPVSCCSISILCLPGTELFDDGCGCGCIATNGPLDALTP
jgi:hypothetical protein